MPAGVMPGQAFHVQTPTGAMLQTVPAGVEPGQTIMITLEQTMQPGSLNTATGTTAAFDGSWKMRTSLCCETNTATVTGTDTENVVMETGSPCCCFCIPCAICCKFSKTVRRCSLHIHVWPGPPAPQQPGRPCVFCVACVRTMTTAPPPLTTTHPTDQLEEERF